MPSEAVKSRESLLKELIEYGCLKSKEIISAFRKVKRENFVLPRYRKYAYANEPLPIEEGQTVQRGI